jgi:asparagine synthase (glutamine-hydrolysing)
LRKGAAVSIQFGRWNFDGRPIDVEYVENVNALLAPYGPDGSSEHSTVGFSIVYRSFHTTPESRGEKQPQTCGSGTVITFDGRLDNRAELARHLAHAVSGRSSDAEIVAAAHEEWGKSCFARLTGDWALAVWNPQERSLLLAKDPIGVRPLYYWLDPLSATWSTILDPLVVLAGCRLELCREYIAGWLGFFPATHLTPYAGIHSVPPSSFVLIRPGRSEARKYWDFDPGTRIRYQTDGAYEEHFLGVFGQSVRRRLRSERPVLAELSGGMDSSSIVCVADAILERTGGMLRLDTVSYYDDSEPNWNERPYFTKVEEKRGRAGWHIDAGAEPAFDFDGDYRIAAPGSGSTGKPAAREFASCIAAGGHRVVLSGIGGDEVTGGSPNPAPELMDLLTHGQFARLAHQLKCWALEKRRPWFHLLFEAVREFLPAPQRERPASWLAESFAISQRKALAGYASRIRLQSGLPSFQQDLSTIDAVRRQVASIPLPDDPLREVRYPFLDRDLLEFLFAIPREQLVRPGERRSLLRRSMRSLVPDEILNRRRKAYVARSPLAAISREWVKIAEATRHMTAASLGIVDEGRLRAALDRARRGESVPAVTLMRTLGMEFWLKAMIERGILAPNPAAAAREATEAAKGWERHPSSAS